MAKRRAKSKNTKRSTAPKQIATSDSINEGISSTALGSVHQPEVMKVCRLCEVKDGPFLNIFEADKMISKKIEELMPFKVSENDDLPHRICFRCSAKVEELHEFIQKCIKAQENLRSALGKVGTSDMKSETFVIWEKKLNDTKISNGDLCDVLIKRAMQGIPLTAPIDNTYNVKSLAAEPAKGPVKAKEESSESSDSDDEDGINLNQFKLSFEKTDELTPVSRTSRSQNQNSDAHLLDGLGPPVRKTRTYAGKKSILTPPAPDNNPESEKTTEAVVEEKPKDPPPKPQEPVIPFNIMDHVSTIKVNSVGILFQCHLCVRNFLRKDLVLNHSCAKNNGPKDVSVKTAPAPEPPKPPQTVKYIKMDKNFKNSVSEKSVEKELASKPETEVTKAKPRSKPGPASKFKRDLPIEVPKEIIPQPKTTPPETQGTSAPSEPSVHFPSVPSLSSRYKLVPGPNNTFTLVEETPQSEKTDQTKPKPKSKKRKTLDTVGPAKNKQFRESPVQKSSSPELIDLDTNQSSHNKPEPYPVGLFQPIPHHSSVCPPSNPPVPFTTPAMKKQSYTIVQTGNPSKLLISTKPQSAPETSKIKLKNVPEESKDLYKGSLEETAPAKDPGFFTFMSVDRLLQPSYVLPTANIIQESQITTSTSKPATDKAKEYSCNMCGENFSREKKLLAHIQSHYNQMDEEDQKRTGKPGPKRKTRKS